MIDEITITANECLDKYWATTDEVQPGAQTRGLRILPPLLGTDRRYPGNAVGARVFIRFVLRELATFEFRARSKYSRCRFTVNIIADRGIPDENYVAWLLLRQHPSKSESGIDGRFTLIYDPERIQQLCEAPWCRELMLVKVILHECGHGACHVDSYLDATGIFSATPRQESEAYRFNYFVYGEAVGDIASWSKATTGIDSAWIY